MSSGKTWVRFAVVISMGIVAIAGELVGGTVKMRMDISGKFVRETPGKWYPAWRGRVMKQFKRFTSPDLPKVSTFIRTDIPVSADGKIVRGAVYQCVETPGAFFLPGEFARIHLKKKEVTDTWRDQLAVSPDRSVILIERFGPSMDYANYKFDGSTVEWMGNGKFAWPDWMLDEVVK